MKVTLMHKKKQRKTRKKSEKEIQQENIKDVINSGNENKEKKVKETKESLDTVTITHGKPAYEKQSFFDNLNLDTNQKREDEKIKSKAPATIAKPPLQDLEEQRHLDAQTFGSVAEQYRVASVNKPNFSNQYQNRGNFRYDNRYRGGQQQFNSGDRYYTTTRPTPQAQQQQQQEQHYSQRRVWQPRQ